MIGEVFGRLTVVEQRPSDRHGKRRWFCTCSCGGDTVAVGTDLRTGNTKSCGCYGLEQNIASKTKHGKAGTSTHNIWKEMVQRCTNPKHARWDSYGGRGITVCAEWQGDNGFAQFLGDMGERPDKLVLDREDNDKGYSKENCRWVTYSVSNKNRRKYTMSLPRVGA